MILVTGASGFLGAHLLKELIPLSIPIRALYHKNPPAVQDPRIAWYACDLLDPYAVEEAMKGITMVYHCAAIVSFDQKDHHRVINDNQAATANVVNEALDAGVRKLVHVSSIASLGRALTATDPISEETHWQDSSNNSAYAVGKYYAEMEVWRAMAEGLNAVVVNPGIILGEGNWDEGSAALIKTAYKEFPWYTEGVNGWVDVQDVARAMVLLMDSDLIEERFILTEGNHSYKSIFSLMAGALGKKPPHKKASPLMTALIWRLSAVKSMLTGKKVTITKETARTAQTQCFYDNQKWLQAMPGFSFTPIKETIARMAAAFLKTQT
ncbi:3-beta hydroxysteroid dehydrogenase [Taibaiella sp. KBW10]|uniref:NAD-dependent epimerase/dehydratase family protein n=1 Tax=Taibaiella sp. KBW10 TaxID=2153357 RepID=UPI000F5A8E13|nr:NAD-dependent epimerase/dehydratase family protein [Taibaiella sp. KBW10]RQO31478.1 3-beta hydroxysteroid dehydrogenase [Taibaiella sp. KBW10]